MRFTYLNNILQIGVLSQKVAVNRCLGRTMRQAYTVVSIFPSSHYFHLMGSPEAD